MQGPSLPRKFDLSIFQRLFISHLGLGLLIFALCGLIYFLYTKNSLEKEIKSDFSNALNRVSIYFDKTYTSKISQDLSFIEDSSILDEYLNSSPDEAIFVRPLVEDLLLHFTKANGIYLSARFINYAGQEKVIASGAKRLRNYTDRHNFSEEVFYQALYRLFDRLKNSKSRTILFEGPFEYQGKTTFLAGVRKEDSEVGGFAGMVAFHCDLTDFLGYLEKITFAEENVARAFTFDNQQVFPPGGLSGFDEKGKYNFYSSSRTLFMGSMAHPFLKVEFKVPSSVLDVRMKKAFKYFIFWILVSVLPIGIIAYFLSKHFSEPLISLIGFMEHFARGDFKVRAKARAGGEVRLLIDSFNRMAEDLQKITVSEDQLRREVDKRKGMEETLRKAYEDLQKVHDELQQTQMQLLQSEKLVALGHLAAGVAHEINNPMVFIINNTEMLGRYINDYIKMLRMLENLRRSITEGDLEKAKISIQEMGRFEQEIDPDYVVNDTTKLLQYNRIGIERIRKIVKDLQTFAHEGPDSVETSTLEEIIESILGLLKSEFQHKAELRKDYSSTPPIKCSVQKIAQVFINLLMNAVQAITETGTIGIRTYMQGKYICVDITDTGMGIKPEDLNKIFDPFFTTKPLGQGTGLGLSLSYEIIKQHGGDIKVQSKLWEGTTFTVMLPSTSSPLERE